MSIAAAIAEFDVAQWASRHGGKPDGKDRRVMLIDCPFCLKRLHLWVSILSKRWECFVCGEGNGRPGSRDPKNIIALIMDVEHIGVQDALRVLETNQSHVPVDSIKPLRKGVRRNVETKRTEDYDPDFWKPQSFDPKIVNYPRTFRLLPPEGNDYTRSRGIPHGASTWFRLGECTGGWLRGRLVFPVFHNDDLIYWVARDMTGKADKKVLNLPSKKTGAVGSKEVLLNLDRAVTVDDGHIILCEGPISAAVMGPEAVASFGKTLSGHQIRRMIEYGVKKVTAAWDGDAYEDCKRVAERLNKYFDTSWIEFPHWKDDGNIKGKDPADLGYESCRKYLADATPVQLANVMNIPELS